MGCDSPTPQRSDDGLGLRYHRPDRAICAEVVCGCQVDSPAKIHLMLEPPI